MSDLMDACTGAGFDSSRYKPIAHAMPDGRVAVYIGGAYAYLPIGKALNLRDQITRSITEVQGHAGTATNDVPESFEVQLRKWRAGVPMPELSTARRLEFERRAMEAMQSEAQS